MIATDVRQQHRWAYIAASASTLLFGAAALALAVHWAVNVEVDPEDSRWTPVVLMAGFALFSIAIGVGGLRNQRWAALPMVFGAALVGTGASFLLVPILLAGAVAAGALYGRPPFSKQQPQPS